MTKKEEGGTDWKEKYDYAIEKIERLEKENASFLSQNEDLKNEFIRLFKLHFK